MLDKIRSSYFRILKNVSIPVMYIVVVNIGGIGAWRGDQVLLSTTCCLPNLELIPKGGINLSLEL